MTAQAQAARAPNRRPGKANSPDSEGDAVSVVCAEGCLLEPAGGDRRAGVEQVAPARESAREHEAPTLRALRSQPDRMVAALAAPLPEPSFARGQPVTAATH